GELGEMDGGIYPPNAIMRVAALGLYGMHLSQGQDLGADLMVEQGRMTVSALDSLRQLVAHKDSLLELAATRSVQITTPAPSVKVNVLGDAWWNTPLVGGALAAVLGIGATHLFGLLHRRFIEKPRLVN